MNNAAGFGFSGVDKNGNFCWDLLSNLNIWKIETATSFKVYLENWNIQTAIWLKRVCYERVPWYPTVLTFILSALWHGVYPGYYFTFLTGILVTLAARTVRNNYRYYFLSSGTLKLVYDVVTWAVTQLAVSYTVAPFVMLAVEPTISLYKSMYFYLHIVSLLIILFLPVRPHAHMQRQPQTLNSVNKKKADWYLQAKWDKENFKTLWRWYEKAQGFSSDLQAMFTCIFFFFFLSAGSIFIKPFLYY